MNEIDAGEARPAVPSRGSVVRLLQLASPTLPVGAFSYSQALEQAVDGGAVHSEESAGRWIGDALALGVARWEAAAVASMHRAWLRGDEAAVRALDREFVASRETAELRAETLQMGHSLARLASELVASGALAQPFGDCMRRMIDPAYPTVWSGIAAAWQIADREAIEAYLWSWLENQVMAAVKLVPLGQSAGQRLLARLAAPIAELAAAASAREPSCFANWLPGLAIASALHETQYSRLFRS